MYTVAEEAKLKEMYEASKEIDPIAKELGKSNRSIISKLVTLSLYVPKAKVSKVTGDAPKTKASYVRDLENALGTSELKDLDKAPKTTLIMLLSAVEQLVFEEEEEEDGE